MSDVSRGVALAEHTRGRLIVLEGSGHAPHLRDPVKVNLLLRDFAKPPTPPRRWVRGKSRRKRELRKMRPEIEVERDGAARAAALIAELL
jgi:hypothetical protein